MEVASVKIIYIPLRRNTIINFAVIAFLFVILLSINAGDAMTVLNPAGNEAIYKGNENKPVVALECNVVWGTEYVGPMLDILKENDIRITFFIGGEWAKDNPELLKRMAEEGHEIGNHGYSHKHHNNLNLDGNKREILETEKVIESILGIKTRLFAPPYGEFNKTTLQAAGSLGYRTIMWSIDTIDWRRDGTEKIIQRVMKNPHNGALILMHPTKDTLTALPVIIDKLQGLGYRFGTVSEAISE
jgi:probable sporulation protein (polysaccharide deacetylase family)